MQKEFTISKKIKIVLFPNMFLMFVIIMKRILDSHAKDLGFIFPLVIILLLCWWIAFSLVRSRIIVSKNSIIYITAFKTVKMYFSEIKGVRINKKLIHIEPKTSAKNTITISNYVLYSANKEFTKWLKTTFVNLNMLTTLPSLSSRKE